MLREVIELHSLGWMPVPIPKGQKGPVLKGWQDRRLTKEELASHFSNGQNVGLLLGKPSGGLVDVDLDWPEACAIANHLLPMSRMMSGHASAPCSHYWYVCDPLVRTTKFIDPIANGQERSMIVEVRSTGTQTVVAPSLHPSGEIYEWYGPLQPTLITGDALLAAVAELATCALVARYWKRGQRHHTALAVAGMLLRAQWERRRVEDFIRLAAITAGDEQVDDRLRAVQTTQQRIESGQRATGLPALAELISEKVVRALQKWLNLPIGAHASSYSESSVEILVDELEYLRSLAPDSSPGEIESALRQFAARIESHDALAREIARENAIRVLRACGYSSPARLIDAAMPQAMQTPERNATERLLLKDPDPWPEPVNGAALLDEIAATTARFLSAEESTFIKLTLWAVYSHVFNAFDISPLLIIVSPEKRCGKSTLLTLLGTFVPRALFTSNITASALFRTIEKFYPTLLIDEADTFLTGDETLRGILNSGHQRNAAYIIRTNGDDYEPRQFTTWAPKAIAMIGKLPATLEDRGIKIKMQRKHSGEDKEKLRLDRMQQFELLCRRAARWAADNLDLIKAADPEVPQQITNDRARDNWRVLLSIADVAGSDWPRKAREAACSMMDEEADSGSVGVLLLSDLKSLFDERGERVSSEQAIKVLIEIEGHPWGEWKGGKPLTKTGLANLLRPFDIRPRKWREGNDTQRGYQRSDFEDAFSRYLEEETPQPPHENRSTGYDDNQPPQSMQSVAFLEGGKSNGINDVAFVADQEMAGNSERESFEL